MSLNPEDFQKSEKTPEKNILLLSCGEYPNDGTVKNGELPNGERFYLNYAKDHIKEHFGTTQEMIDGTEPKKKILFVPYAKEKDKWGFFEDFARQALEPMGVEVVSAHTLGEGKEQAEAFKKGGFDGVFIGGGSTQTLLKELKRTGLDKAIKTEVDKGMPYGGESAGSNVAGLHIRVTNDMPVVELDSHNAMGLVNYAVNPHHMPDPLYRKNRKTGEFEVFRPGQKSRIQRYFREEENTIPVLGIPEGGVVKIRGEKVEIFETKGEDFPEMDIPTTFYKDGGLGKPMIATEMETGVSVLLGQLEADAKDLLKRSEAGLATIGAGRY